jgi:hypothetical protein
MDDKVLGYCQYPTRLNAYGLPVATCGAVAVEYRPDRVFVRYVCAGHRDGEEIGRPGPA